MADPLLPEMRDVIESAWNRPVVNAFGASVNFDAFIAIPLLSQLGKCSGKLHLQTVQFSGGRADSDNPVTEVLTLEDEVLKGQCVQPQ